jgi:hypothetical protein
MPFPGGSDLPKKGEVKPEKQSNLRLRLVVLEGVETTDGRPASAIPDWHIALLAG